MSTPIERFFNKFRVKTDNIKTLTREEGKTFINLIDGKRVETYFSIKSILDELPKDKFVVINKGVAIALNQIESVDGTTYRLVDGSTIVGRKRRSAKQTQLVHYINDTIEANEPKPFVPSQFSILDKMPVAFCVIEVMFTEHGRGVDFVFRYCNKEMEHIEGKTVDEMIDHSFYEVFPNADRKWLVAYSDVALNGTVRYLNDYSPEVDKQLLIHCFQPMEGFCACLLQAL